MDSKLLHQYNKEVLDKINIERNILAKKYGILPDSISFSMEDISPNKDGSRLRIRFILPEISKNHSHEISN